MGECALAERPESELAKYGTKGQDQKAETLESKSEGIANSKWKKEIGKLSITIFKSIFFIKF